MNEKESSSELKINWIFCPICGTRIPKVDNVKFCTKCGVDLQDIKTHKRLPQKREDRNEKSMFSSLEEQKLGTSYVPVKVKLSDDELIEIKDKRLWSTFSSLGITLLAFVLMNLIVVFATIFFVLFTFDLEGILDMLLSPYFLIFSSFIEFVLIIVPILYVGKYLENPTLKNRFRILGFTVRGFTVRKFIKEMLIGIAFAVIGIILVLSVSFLMELFMYSIFGNEILQSALSDTSDIDTIIRSSDYLSISLLVLIMIIVIGTSEEILFRGFLQKGLVRNLGRSGGILITALIFTTIHLIGIFIVALSPTIFFISFMLNFFPYFAISLLLGLLYEWRNQNLIAVIITHGFYDALTVILVFLLYIFF